MPYYANSRWHIPSLFSNDFIKYICKKCFRTPKKKNLYYSFDCDENLHTHVKSKIKWGNCHELSSVSFVENKLFPENVKNGVRGNEPNGRTVQPTQLIRISLESKFRARQNYRDFFSNFPLVFKLYIFLEECFFA